METRRLNILHLLTLAVLLAAVFASLVVMSRTGEARMTLLAALFVLLAVPHGIGLWTQAPTTLGFDLATAAAAAGLAAALIGLAAVIALRRILLDLDRAEDLHWDSMESVRNLSELAALRAASLEK